MRIAIVGSRDYPNLNQVRNYVYELPRDTVIVSGGARGVDRAAASEARKLGMEVIEFLPDWERLGKRAGFIRNADIVHAADQVTAFWDGKSRGTRHTIHLAWAAGKPLYIISPSYPGGRWFLADVEGQPVPECLQ